MDFDLRKSSAELPQKTRSIHVRFSAKPYLFEFFEAKKWTLRRVFETKTDVWHWPPPNCCRIRQPTTPTNVKLTKFCLFVSRRSLEKLCPKVLSFCRSKKVAKGVLRTDGTRGCLRNSQKKSVKRGNGLRWETAGAALALTARLTKSAAKYAGG